MSADLPVQRVRRLLHLTLDGLVAVHAARAAHTALGGVPGIVSAAVTMAGADVDFEGMYDADRFAADVRSALEPLGMGLASVTLVQSRGLPLA